jgi:hypothetical protein
MRSSNVLGQLYIHEPLKLGRIGYNNEACEWINSPFSPFHRNSIERLIMRHRFMLL